MEKKKVSICEVLEWYDIPMLFIAVDEEQNKYVCVTYDTKDGDILAIGLFVSEEELACFVDGKTELLALMKSKETSKDVFDIMMSENSYATKRQIPIEDYMFCSEGYYVSKNDEDEDLDFVLVK